MKKNNLWKAIGICFIAYIVLSWLIPVGTFSNGVLSKGDTAPLGFLDIFRYPIITATTSLFVLNALIILLIGGFYGVLNQTGAYGTLVDKCVLKFKKKSHILLGISIVVFALLASLTGVVLPLFILVPFFVAVILKLNYSKVIALLSTVGAILVGNMASTYGSNINGYISYFFETKINDTILARVLFLVVMVALLICFVLWIHEKQNKINTKKEDTVIPLYQNHVDKKKSTFPMLLIASFMLILALVGMYNWELSLNIDFFRNIYKSITEFEISGYLLFNNIIGSVDPMGYWSGYEIAIILFLGTMLIAWIYNVKGQEKWKAFVDGVKEMVPVALYTIAANILFLLMYSTSTGSLFFHTIANFFMQLTKGFNVFTFGAMTMVGSVFFNDFPYLVNALYDPIISLYTNYGFIGMFMQMLHGFMMLIVPTSVILVAGLKYLDISYTEWLKNIWKFLIVVLVAIAAFTVGLLLIG